MDESTRRRLFEPFFTTKVDVGTGLGLSTIYDAVTRWEGRVDVQSAPGQVPHSRSRCPHGMDL